MRRQRCHGFTVIELVAVVAVTAIVCALVYSAYRTHAVRTEVAEGIRAAARVQEAVVHAFQGLGEAPGSAADVQVSAGELKGRVLEAISVVNGRVDLVFGGEADAAIAGRLLALTPYESASLAVVWVCGNEIPGPGLRPLGFAGAGRQAAPVPATVEARFLPPECR